ncbi:MAG: hypothetical protein RL060_1032 [Bacteroidota bacterium]
MPRIVILQCKTIKITIKTPLQMKKTVLLLYTFLVSFASIYAQESNGSDKWLLLDLNIQVETNEAINDLYNFKFDKAKVKFEDLKKKYPNHPIAYFLLGLSEYWKILPNENNTEYDESFHLYLDSTITLAEKLYDEDPTNYEAAFFLTASYGFKGKLYAIRHKYMMASNEGRKALKYLKLEKKATEMSPEFMFGTALYNYFREKIYEDYFWLRPLIKLSSSEKGDKELGIKQLNEVALNAFYTRTEAQAYLLDIYINYENKRDQQALPIAKYLHETYPDNPYFQKYYAKLCSKLGHTTTTEKVAIDFIDKYNKHYLGYEDVGLRSASFYLGTILKNNYGQFEKAKHHLITCVNVSEKLKRTSGYYIYSLEALVDICDSQKDYKEAIDYCHKIIKNGDKDLGNESESIKNAKIYLKNIKAKEKAAKQH